MIARARARLPEQVPARQGFGDEQFLDLRRLLEFRLGQGFQNGRPHAQRGKRLGQRRVFRFVGQSIPSMFFKRIRAAGIV